MKLGETFLASFLEVLHHRLGSPEILNYLGSLRGGIGKRVDKWRGILYKIAEVLNDAEDKQLTSEEVEMWLDDLRDLAYDVEDVLDMFSTRILRRMVNERNHNQAGTSKVRGLFPKVKFFKYSMNSEIEAISRRLQEISECKDKLGLKYIRTTSTNRAWKRPLSSDLLSGVPVVGRDNDREKIVKLLSSDEPNTPNFQVVAIVGMGGVGKTTLAQLLLSEDSGAMNQFNPKIWVFVSDEFNLVRITKAILESVTSKPCHLEEFNNIQENLSKELAGKKFLLILDDVWNTCDYDLWEKLQSPFRHGAHGSKIIVTTRDSKVARTMGATKVYNLQCISDDDCWKVFEQNVFNVNSGVHPNFVLFREKIVARCSGLPLAARTLGGLLGCKDNEEWEDILNNKLWSLAGEENILPVLKLSYHYLPSNMKRCFAYCSILPNGYEFGEMQLILLWMAEGLLQQPKVRKEMEDIGGDYFGELLSRSLFQKSSKSHSLYVMHDLVSDLARWAAGELCFTLGDKPNGSCSAKTRHLAYVSGKYDGVKIFEAISKVKFEKLEAFREVKRLRTFLPLTLVPNPQAYLTTMVTHDLVPNLQSLRVLSLNGYQITELPNSIGMLKYLRYFDLSHTLLTSLPESTSTLYNLQTLILEGCSKLKELPTNLRNLTNLRHLKNSNVPSLEGMPPQLSQLTSLQTLSNFVVGEGSESRVKEVGPLLLLRGTLRLSRLENVVDAEHARDTNLIRKEGLDAVELEWSDSRKNESIVLESVDAEHARDTNLIRKEGLDAVELEWSDLRKNESVVLDMLKPHEKLKELTIKGYRGLQFSTWIGDQLYSNMVTVRLENCNHCRLLPPLGQLPSLSELFICGMSGVECVGPEFYGKGSLSFPLLQTLKFEDMEQWKEWIPFEGDQGIRVFPSLKILSIQRCPKLKGRLPENLDSLAKLDIRDCDKLGVSISPYKQLCKLWVDKCEGVVYTSEADFELLKHISFSSFQELTLQTEGLVTGLRNVETFIIARLASSSWTNVDRLLQHMISLLHLHIVGSSQILQLHHLTSLQVLHIYGCSSFVSFPEASLPKSLATVKIELCNSLMYFARNQIPASLREIEIRECKKLKLLVEGEVEGSSSSSSQKASCLEFLQVSKCPSLTSLSSRGQLPSTLKHLYIEYCEQLESITDSFRNNTCLEDIRIYTCENLKSLPAGLCHLANLHIFRILDCGSLVSFPRGGFQTRVSNLTHISIRKCNKLEALPKGMGENNLNSLQSLEIANCKSLARIPEGGFPPNLVSLKIMQHKSSMPLSEWWLHLHRLTSLKQLLIKGVDANLVSFPPEKEMEMLLPKSLIKLRIADFPNLIKLGKSFQFLRSLESLEIRKCPMLESIPGKALPLSLTHLIIQKCPVLEEKCRPVPCKGRYWPKIAHIAYKEIGDWKITDSPS